jgi:hypothetical protein
MTKGTKRKLSTSDPMNETDNEGYTAFHRACQLKDVEEVRRLLPLVDAHKTTKDSTQWTPLGLACAYDYSSPKLTKEQQIKAMQEIVTMLLHDTRFHPNQNAKQGQKLLAVICEEYYEYGGEEMLELLLTDPRTDVNINEGEPIRFLCGSLDNTSGIVQLLQDPRLILPVGEQSPLHMVCACSYDGNSIEEKIAYREAAALLMLAYHDRGVPMPQDVESDDIMIQTWLDKSPKERVQQIRKDMPGMAEIYDGKIVPEYNRQGAAHLFTLGVMLCDDYQKLKTPLTAEQEKVVKFFTMFSKLNMDIQMKLSNVVFGNAKGIVSVRDVEKALCQHFAASDATAHDITKRTGPQTETQYLNKKQKTGRD